MGNKAARGRATSTESREPQRELRAVSFELEIARKNASKPALFRGIASSPQGWLYIVYGNALVVMDPMRVQRLVYGDCHEKGMEDGAWNVARFNRPRGIHFFGESLYICDLKNCALRRIRPTNGTSIHPASTIGPRSSPYKLESLAIAASEEEGALSGYGRVETYAGQKESKLRDGPIQESLWCAPLDMTLGKDGSNGTALFVLDWVFLRMISSDERVYTVTYGPEELGNGAEAWYNPLSKSNVFPGLANASSICAMGDGRFLVTHGVTSATDALSCVYVLDLARRHYFPVNGTSAVDILEQDNGYFWHQPKGLTTLNSHQALVCDSSTNWMGIISCETKQEVVVGNEKRGARNGSPGSGRPAGNSRGAGGNGTTTGMPGTISVVGQLFHHDLSCRRPRDGPIETAKTIGPAFATLVPSSGDLVWIENVSHPSECHGKIRYVPNFASSFPATAEPLPPTPTWPPPPQKPTDDQSVSEPTETTTDTSSASYKAFNALLAWDQSHQFADFTLLHLPSKTYLYLNKCIISLAAPRLLDPLVADRVTNAKVSSRALRAFLDMLYGAPVYHPGEELGPRAALLELTEILHLFSLVELEGPLISLLEHRLFALIGSNSANLGQDLLSAVAKDIDSASPLLLLIKLSLDTHHPVTLTVPGLDSSTTASQPLTPASRVKEPDLTPLAANWTILDAPLAEMWRHIVAVDLVASEAQDLAVSFPNFRIDISGSDKIFFVHDWLLYARWPYFKRAMDSGFSEASSGLLSLPDTFPPRVLHALLGFMYAPDAPLRPQLDLEEWRWIAENGAQFGISKIEDTSPISGFEPIHNHMKRVASAPLTIYNAIGILRLRAALKDDFNVLVIISKFLLKNAQHFEAIESLKQQAVQLARSCDLGEAIPELSQFLQAVTEEKIPAKKSFRIR